MSTRRTASVIIIPNPIDSIVVTVDSIKTRLAELFDSFIASTRQERISAKKFLNNASLPKFNFNIHNINKKKILQIAIPVLVVLLLVFAVSLIFRKGPAVAGVNTSASLSTVKTTNINREFKFPLKDDKGKQIGSFAYTIESAELRKQIIVKGQTATAVPGRIFLTINIKIVNGLKQGLEINSRDYIRFEVNGKTNELFAADIHNDPVEAQAISTKNTRIGLAINESDRDIKLQVGEINGPKIIIPVSF